MQSSHIEVIEHADSLYAKRIEIENVRLIVELLEEMAAGNYEASWRLGRSFFFLGQEAKNQAEARVHHSKGIQAADHAVKLQPDRVEGHFWLGVNLALMAQLKNKMSALFFVWRAKRSLRRALRLDPSYHAAGSLRLLGRIQHRLPRIFGGGRKRARANYERALELAPDNTVTRFYFAELLIEIGEMTAAREQLETILQMATDPPWEFESKRDRKLAKETLALMGK